MFAWKSIGKVSLCALTLWGCSNVADSLPFVNRNDDDNKQDSFTLKAKVRDFREGNATDNTGTHPHFNQTRYTCEANELGASVQADLATDGASDPAFPGDNRNPVLATDMVPDLSRCFDPPDRFGDWFEDRGEDVNRPFLYDMNFTKDGAGYFRFRQDAFFPLDNGSTFKKTSDAGAGPYGYLQTGQKDEVDLSQHNYGFTLELHGEFTYSSGKGYNITARGDDDLWIFINGKRVLDLGGTHPAVEGSVDLDALGLENDQVYALDIFFAERSVASSRLMIQTNFRVSGAK